MGLRDRPRRPEASEVPGPALTVVRLLAAALGEHDPEQPARGREWAGLAPHMLAVLRSAGPLAGTSEEELADCAVLVSQALLSAGAYEAALEIAQAGLAFRTGLPDSHPLVLDLRFRRASAWRFLGSYADAEAEFRQILDAQQRILGPGHPSTLRTRHALGRLPGTPRI